MVRIQGLVAGTHIHLYCMSLVAGTSVVSGVGCFYTVFVIE